MATRLWYPHMGPEPKPVEPAKGDRIGGDGGWQRLLRPPKPDRQLVTTVARPKKEANHDHEADGNM